MPGMCSHVTDTPAAALLRKMATRYDHEGIPQMNARPNIVLIHGAWAEGSCWSGVIERLQAGERQFAARMGAATVEIASSHVAMVSDPGDVTQLIKTAAEAVPATS
jgi:hypothetical protein